MNSNNQLELPSKITHISVSGLLGDKNFEIPINENLITLLTGENGIGKSTLLNLIFATLNFDCEQLIQIAFTRINIDFLDGRCIEVYRGSDSTASHFIVIRINNNVQRFRFEEEREVGLNARVLQNLNPQRFIDEELPQLQKIKSDNRFLDLSTGEELSPRQVTQKFGDLIPARILDYWTRSFVPPEMEDKFSDIRIARIDANRLVGRILDAAPSERRGFPARRSQFRKASAVRDAQTYLQMQIRQALADYGRKSQELDQTFAERLVTQQGADPSSYSRDEIERKGIAVAEDRKRLANLNLIEKSKNVEVRLPNLEPESLKIMHTYYEDHIKKNGELIKFANKLELLTNLINQKFKNKLYEIDRDEGFLIKDENGNLLDPDKLSSGEQHLIVLFHNMLTSREPSNFYLIDEPEISLHIAWQLELLTDLEAIGKLVPAQHLIATHSPQIIGHRFELEIPLEPKYA